jgi:hypothetical protein
MQRAAALGDIDSLTLTTAQLETVLAEQTKLNALADAQATLGALEDAVRRPLEGDDLKSFILPRPLPNPMGGQPS